jgi:hypothetical protein
MQPVNSVGENEDYPNGELTIFPGDTNTTLKLMAWFLKSDSENYDRAYKKEVREARFRLLPPTSKPCS